MSIVDFSPIAIYQGWLMVGYATIYTMFPAFSFVLDRDINEDLALLYPELYKDLTKGRSLSYKTFFTVSDPKVIGLGLFDSQTLPVGAHIRISRYESLRLELEMALT